MVERGRGGVGDGGRGGWRSRRRNVVVEVTGEGGRHRRWIRRWGLRRKRVSGTGKVEKGGRVHGDGDGILVISGSFDF